MTNGGSGVPYTRGTRVVVRNTPVASGELLNQDLGVYGQDSWTLKRLTVNAGCPLGTPQRASRAGILSGGALRSGT